MPFLFMHPEKKHLHAFRGTRTAGTMSFAFFLKGNGDKSVISQISVV